MPFVTDTNTETIIFSMRSTEIINRKVQKHFSLLNDFTNCQVSFVKYPQKSITENYSKTMNKLVFVFSLNFLCTGA